MSTRPAVPGAPTGPIARRIGVIGGGQLARMMIPAGIELGLEVRVLAASASDSAALVGAHVSIGAHDDPAAVAAFARGVDVITFDHEHVPAAILEDLVASGVAVRPGPSALIYAQDKLLMRERLGAAGFPCPRWWRIDCAADLEAALDEAGGELIVKTPRGGYDGSGVRVVRHASDVSAWLERPGALLAEEKVPFVRELSAQVARRPGGQAVAYPVVESEQRRGVCYRVSAPAPGLGEDTAAQIQALALGIAHELNVVGMLAVELFALADGSVAVNELAMRPHNTGHWSMDGAVTGQFHQHLRAVADLPLGDTRPVAGTAVMVNLLGEDRDDLVAGAALAMQADPAIAVHLYGKQVRPGRKVGHVNLVGGAPDEARARALSAATTIVRTSEGELA